MKTWTRIKGHRGLRRHKGGTIYLHAKVGGQPHSRSLGTTEVFVACRKRDQFLAQSRENPMPLGADLSVRRFIELQRSLIEGSGAKPRTIQYNLSSLATLEKGWPRPERSIRDFSTIEVELMMARYRKRYSPTRFNGISGNRGDCLPSPSSTAPGWTIPPRS